MSASTDAVEVPRVLSRGFKEKWARCGPALSRRCRRAAVPPCRRVTLGADMERHVEQSRLTRSELDGAPLDGSVGVFEAHVVATGAERDRPREGRDLYSWETGLA